MQTNFSKICEYLSSKHHLEHAINWIPSSMAKSVSLLADDLISIKYLLMLPKLLMYIYFIFI